MQLTGNPFVDTGLMVLSTLADKETVDDLTLLDVRKVFGNGSALARANQRLKSYTMVFGTNGPLTQPAYKKAKKNESVYLGTLSRLLAQAEREGGKGEPCDLTGIRSDLDFQAVTAAALSEAGLPAPESKWIGRDWVPLGGSLGNDAQALPGASRPLHVCALALFAMQYLPLGLFLFKGKLTCYQSTDLELPQSLVSAIVEKNGASLDREILGKGSGSRIILEALLTYFEELQANQRDKSLPENTELILWLFSNSGTGADCMIERVPEFALRFVSEACRQYAHDIRTLLQNDPKDPRFQLFECIRSGRDYPGLYPFRKWRGASPGFYDFYQERIRGTEPSALSTAREVAAIVIGESSEKNRKEIRKPEFLRSPAGRNRVRRAIAEHISMAQYDSLFPSSRHPIRVSQTGWDLVRFYLSTEESAANPQAVSVMKTTHPKIIQIGDAYFRIKGTKKIKNTLDRLAQRKLGVRWLQDVFCAMAEDERYKDFNLGTWDEFACDEDGKPVVFELLFQMRLHLANKYRESITQPKEMNA
jgi:CRISPR-associated protein Cst1